MTLQRLTPDDQTLVVCQMAETLVACDRDAKPLEKSQLAAIQRQIVDACPVLLEVGWYTSLKAPAISYSLPSLWPGLAISIEDQQRLV